MQNKKNQSSVGLMIQRCHKWRMRRKQLTDQARITSDDIERERLLQAAEHCVRMTNAEQEKIDSLRDPKDAITATETEINTEDKNSDNKSDDDCDLGFPDFITGLN